MEEVVQDNKHLQGWIFRLSFSFFLIGSGFLLFFLFFYFRMFPLDPMHSYDNEGYENYSMFTLIAGLMMYALAVGIRKKQTWSYWCVQLIILTVGLWALTNAITLIWRDSPMGYIERYANVIVRIITSFGVLITYGVYLGEEYRACFEPPLKSISTMVATHAFIAVIAIIMYHVML